MPRPQFGATKDRLVRVQARSVTGPRHRPPRAGAGWPCSPSPDRQGRDRPEVAPRPRQIDPSEQMLRLASAPRIRPPRAGSRTILAPMPPPPSQEGPIGCMGPPTIPVAAHGESVDGRSAPATSIGLPRPAGLCAPPNGLPESVTLGLLLSGHRLDRESQSGDGRDQDE